MASVASLAFGWQFSFSDRAARLLDRIDCRLACSGEEREAIFRLRYRAPHAVRPRPAQRANSVPDAWRGADRSSCGLKKPSIISSIHGNLFLFKGLRPIEIEIVSLRAGCVALNDLLTSFAGTGSRGR